MIQAIVPPITPRNPSSLTLIAQETCPPSTLLAAPPPPCNLPTPLSQGSATHKHRRYGNNGHRHNYRRGFGTLRKKCCGTN